MTSDTLLTADGISRRYGARFAVHDLTLTLRRGEVLGLLGLNGAGKSTALQMLTGVLAPDTGRVTLGGFDLARDPKRAKRVLGYLPEVPPLYPEARVDEYLDFCAALHRVQASLRAGVVAAAKARCGLTAVGPRLIRNLSKGYQQRVGIAQAIIHDPTVLILDEPTAGLDPAQMHEMRELIRTLGAERAILLSTHLLTEAASICSRVVIVHHGRMVYDAALNHGAYRLALELRAAPPRATLAALAAVVDVHDFGAGKFELEVNDFDRAAEAIGAAAAQHGWGLRELKVGDSALERTFLGLTRDHTEAST
ncbi:MAG: ATP-binding cassette domain-containing protein [Gammaproteobacteria bacterium]|nr:ATP-binding cassette domain-containing protein [Gammaproteobacteria bacterium]